MNNEQSSQVYKYYKPFKNIQVGYDFILTSHTYEKVELCNRNGITSNAVCLDSASYAYIPDYEWVIDLEEL